MSLVTLSVDGTDNAANKQFQTLSAALAYQNTNYPNLTTDNGSGAAGPVAIEISITSADSSWAVPALTTSADNYLSIYTTASARHAGTWTTGKYRSQEGNLTNTGFIRIDGLQIYRASSGNGASGVYIGDLPVSNDIRISNCIIVGAGGAVSDYAIKVNNTDAVVSIWNTICYGFGTADYGYGIYVLQGTSAAIYNCTVIGEYVGISNSSGGTVTAKNVYASKVSASAGAKAFDGTISQSYCASSDTTATGTGAVTGVSVSTSAGAYFSNVTAGSQDFHIAPANKASSALYDAGDAPGGSAPLNYTTDIDGETVAFWCIGADSFATSGQFARPASDVADGNWLKYLSGVQGNNTDLFSYIDEATTPDDTDTIRSGTSPSNDTCTVGLSSISSPAAGTVTIRVRARWL